MVDIKNRKGKGILLGIIFLALSFLVLGVTVPVFANDVEIGTDLAPIDFSSTSPYDVPHYDQPGINSEYWGFFWIHTKNSSDIAWNDFHLDIYELPGEGNQDPGVFFIAGDCSIGKGGETCDPHSDITIDSWVIDNGGKSLSLFFDSNVVNPGEHVWFRVYTDNRANARNFGISSYPSLVPEPISSTLFIVGGATLGFRRFRKKFKK